MIITSNYASYDGSYVEALELTVNLSGSNLSWSLRALSQYTTRWDLYNIDIRIGGVQVYYNTLGWADYTPNTVIASGTKALSQVTITSGQVTCSASCGVGSTWRGLVSCSGNLAVAYPSVTLTISESGKYDNKLISQYSTLSFSMSSSSQSGGSITSMSLLQNGSVIWSGTSGSGSTSMVCPSISANSANYSYTLTATDSNGLTTTTSAQSKTVYSYTPPSFTKVTSTRWSSGSASGSASDTGTYMRALAVFTSAKVGGSNISTSCTVETTGVSTTSLSNNTAVYVGGSLSYELTYTVTYKLWDGVRGTSAKIVQTDNLSVGGRCIDLIYTGGEYGVAIGTKAQAGRFDVNMPLYGTQTMDSSGVGATLTSVQRQAICNTLGIATTSDLNTILTTIIGRL